MATSSTISCSTRRSGPLQCSISPTPSFRWARHWSSSTNSSAGGASPSLRTPSLPKIDPARPSPHSPEAKQLAEKKMTETFKAILVSRDADKKQSVAVTDLSDADLMEGDVTVAVE